MKLPIVIIVALAITGAVSSESYKDQFYDYDYSESERTSDDKRLADDTYADDKPSYDLKDAPKLFLKFIKDYNKQYKNKADFNKHYENFVSNLEYIIQSNKENKDSVADINMFADLSEEEVGTTFL